MLEPFTPLWYAAAAGAGLLIYWLFWWMVGGLPVLARWLTRIFVTIVLLTPAVLYFAYGNQPDRQPTATGPPAASQPRADVDRGRGGAGPTTMPPPAGPPRTAEARKPASAPPPALPPAATKQPELPPAPGGASRGVPVTSAPAPDAGPAPTPAGAPPAADSADWAVVPVLYGTDRNRRDGAKRIDYGSDRARRLELGMAEITIPKVHQVPNVERPWAIRIPILDYTIYEAAEDPKLHFTIKAVKSMTRDEFLAFAKQRLGASSRYKDHALVFIHGYNNGFDGALYRTAQIAYDIDFDGLPMLYSWPSGGGYTSYTYDRDSSVQSEPHMRSFLDLAVRETGAKSVNIVAHSMGNLPLLQVLKDLKRSLPEGVQLNQIILAAPDVDRDIFANLAAEIKGIARGITLYASAADNALLISRQVAGGVPRAGEVPAEGPLVLAGIDTIDVTAASTDVLAVKHNTYAEKKELLKDIGALLLTGRRPPKARLPAYEVVPTPAGDYWRYPVVR